MDIVLSGAGMGDWEKQLHRHFNDLRDRFGPDVQHDPLFNAISVEIDDSGLRLKPICSGADILHAVQCFMGLAIRKLTSSDAPKTKSGEQSTSLEIHKNGTDLTPAIYSSVQFRDANSQIRLIEVLPGRDGDQITIKLFVIDGVSGQDYDALSYVWGSRDTDVAISVNGRLFYVSENLAAALRCLRPTEGNGGRILWVDALCINQADDVEKSAQVAMMGQIYRGATDVIIFLGEEKDDSALVIKYLNIDDVEQTECQPSTGETGHEDLQEHENVAERRVVQARIQRCGFDSAHFLRSADAFFKRPWWSRMWVVQEYVLAEREPRWYCGRVWTSTAHMRDRLAKLYSYLIREAAPLIGDPALATHTQIDIEREWSMMAERRWNMNQLLMDRSVLSRQQRPCQWMHRLVYRHSTDPRDRIFALLEMLDPVSKLMFIPDYTAGVNDIFVKLATYLLVHDEYGHIYNLYQLARSSGVPSWAPDFTRPISVHAVAHLTQYGNKGPWAKHVGRLSIYNGVLGISGVELDTLDVVGCLEDATNDLQILEMFWKLEGLLQRSHPSQALPEVARPYVPSHCLVPFSSLKEQFMKAGSVQLAGQFPTTLGIPGLLHINLETQKLLLAQDPMCNPKNLTCDMWPKTVASAGQTYAQANRRAIKLILASCRTDVAESFLGGACFDLPNLKKQITSVRLPDPNNHNSSSSGGPTNLITPQDNNAETRRNDDNCPQYSHIKDILLQAQTSHEIETLKDMAYRLADMYNGIVTHAANRSAPIAQVAAELTSAPGASEEANSSSYLELSEQCTCNGGKRIGHQAVLKALTEATKQGRHEVDTQMSHLFDGVRIDGYGPAPGLYMALKRQYTGTFITRLGFFGVSFQPSHGFKKGDKVVLLDGIPAPVVLEETGDGGTYRIKAVAHIVGVTDVDCGKLVDLGVCKRRDFKII